MPACDCIPKASSRALLGTLRDGERPREVFDEVGLVLDARRDAHQIIGQTARRAHLCRLHSVFVGGITTDPGVQSTNIKDTLSQILCTKRCEWMSKTDRTEEAQIRDPATIYLHPWIQHLLDT